MANRAGRKPGSKNKLPRRDKKGFGTTELLQHRTTELERWLSKDDVMPTVMRRLMRIVNDDEARHQDQIKVAELLFKYSYGVPQELREPSPVQVLQIVRHEDGKRNWDTDALADGNTVEGMIVRESAAPQIAQERSESSHGASGGSDRDARDGSA